MDAKKCLLMWPHNLIYYFRIQQSRVLNLIPHACFRTSWAKVGLPFLKRQELHLLQQRMIEEVLPSCMLRLDKHGSSRKEVIFTQ